MKVLKFTGSVLLVAASAALVFSAGSPGAVAQAGRSAPANLGWPTYGGDLASRRYSQADEISTDNFNRLEIAWRLKTDFRGPRPDTL